MDEVFGSRQYRNEITWGSGSENSSRRKFGRASDIILFYTKSDNRVFNRQFTPYSQEYIGRTYKHEDDTGRYCLTSCQHNAVRPNMFYEFHGHTKQWRYSQETMRRLEAEGLLVFNKDGVPSKKSYLKDTGGVAINELWTDIKRAAKKEATGYPTQKPVKLLKRIIQASSNEGDLVLDPFCGSGTTLVAAELLDRRYIGIDVNQNAIDKAHKRLNEAKMPMFCD